jgi:hypothetical protein
MFLNLLAGHHAIIYFEADIMYLFSELVVKVIRGVPVSPAHPLEISGLLREVGGEVFLHALNELLELLLLLGEVLVGLGDGRGELARAGVARVAHLAHLLVLSDRRLHDHLNRLHQANRDVQPAVRLQTLQGVRHLVGVQWFTVVCQRTSYQILS